MPLQWMRLTMSRLAAASESAFASGGSGLAAMGAWCRNEQYFLGRSVAVSEWPPPRVA
jgi:hypothetical protein